ncbi:MAG TPA: hypothetical protein VFF16_19440 [Telluria sp.]|nr:hypothetical protein [Telluria sp.]
MLEAKPAARGRTNSTRGSRVDVPVTHRKVAYVFDTSVSNPKGVVAMAVVAHVNGKAVPCEIQLEKKHPCIRSATLFAEAGAKVELFLNGDATYRSHPVYAVQVGANDVQVLIKEKFGKYAEEAVLAGPETCSDDRPDGRTGPLDKYTASLTGDIWMRISHLYTESEAAAIIPPDVHPAIRAAVLSVYRGLAKPSLSVDFPASDSKPASSVRIDFQEQKNPSQNICGFSLLRDGLPRMRPFGYVALLEAAHESGVTRLEVDSGWRPMLGSIAHRNGLGIDVVAISAGGRHTWLQRIGLRGKTLLPREDITPAEKAAYDELVLAVARSQRMRKLVEQRAQEPSLLKASPAERNRAIEEAKTSRDEADAEQSKAREKWRAALPGSQPQPVKLFRTALLTHRFVKQLLDPWYMELDTKDKNAPVENEQNDDLSKLHSTHLHVTILR